MRQTIRTQEMTATPSFFSQRVRVRNTISFSGQVAFDRNGNVVGKRDMGAQTRQAIRNMHAALAWPSAMKTVGNRDLPADKPFKTLAVITISKKLKGVGHLCVGMTGFFQRSFQPI